MIPFRFLLVLLSVFSLCNGATKINFSRCSLSGFTCLTNANKRTDLFYSCPPGVNDIIIYINMMVAPANIERLYIRNCNKLSIATRCTGENKFLSYLEIANITKLSFQRFQYEPMLPSVVVLENIAYIDAIPFRTFAQVDKPYYSVGCSVPKVDFESLRMKNVTIGEVHSNAIVGLTNFKNATFTNVRIKRLHTSGIQMKLDLPGEFKFQNSSIDYVEHLGYQLYTRRATFSGNSFIELASSSINGSVEDFFFVNNTVETVQAYGLSILATNVFILDNNFMHLKSGALEKVSPGLIQDSGRNFGKLKFIYDFSKNVVNFADANGLNPDYVSYENVQTQMMFGRNKFFCSCENMGWLFSKLGHGPNTPQLEMFYKMVLDEASENVCFHDCNLPLKAIERLIGCGKCLKNVTMEKICNPRVERYMKISSDDTTDIITDFSTSTASKISDYQREQEKYSTEQYIFSNGLKLVKENTIIIVVFIQFLISFN